MVLLQSCLLKVQLHTRQNPKLKPLSTFEICSVVAITWIVFMALEGVARGVLGIALALSGNQGLRGQHYGAVFLFRKTLWTWVTHHSLKFGLESLFPLLLATRVDSAAVLHKCQLRGLEVIELMQEIDWTALPRLGSLLGKATAFNERKSHQLISLERHQSDDPVEGARTLNWSIAVDKKALDEMKETLGPPGGFGEMGFSVSQEGVSFEAMGIGTRFNLSFLLSKSPTGDQRPRSPKKKRKPRERNGSQ